MNKEKNIRWIPVLCFGVLMLGLGSSDSLRGIFSPVFQEHYSVGGKGLSMMVVISYVGNLLFLSVGGKMMDTFDRKKVSMGMLGIWMAAVLLNVLTDSYPMILLSMFLALGASTMLNTTVNLLTPMVCAGYAGMMVNIFFFIQGIGTSGSQFLLGRFAFSYDGWKMINGVLFAVGLVSLVLFAMVNLKPEKIKPKTIQKKKPQDMPGASIFWLLVLMMGFYFIGEHGIMNWMLTYCMNALQMPSHTASTYLSIFWGGMTVGRLVFAPVVQKLGVRKSLKYFGGAGTVLFVTGVLSGSKGVILLSSSGLLISILYPTMVLFFQQIYPVSVVATKTGAIISAATIADIVFNAGFGALSDSMGIQISFLILPVCMVLYYCFYLLLLRVSPSEV
ncbi:MAG: MFS transporter [Lachnospiraceae bacterium]|nr:MFS transporter [Lachnospiraceae bacterium]